MNLSATSNAPGSPDDANALREMVRTRDDRIADLQGELGKAQADKVNLHTARAKCRNLESELLLWQQSSERFEQQCKRLATALADVERERTT